MTSTGLICTGDTVLGSTFIITGNSKDSKFHFLDHKKCQELQCISCAGTAGLEQGCVVQRGSWRTDEQGLGTLLAVILYNS